MAEAQALAYKHNGVTLQQAMTKLEVEKTRWGKAEWAMVVIAFAVLADTFYRDSAADPVPLFLAKVFGPIGFAVANRYRKGQLERRLVNLRGTQQLLNMTYQWEESERFRKAFEELPKETLDQVWEGRQVMPIPEVAGKTPDDDVK